MATGGGVSAGAAYNKLEKTDDGISQGLQYWGGIKAKQIEDDKNRAAKKAADDADRAEREGVRTNTDIEGKRFDFTSKDAGYNSLTENYSAFSRAAGEDHSKLWADYATARQNKDFKTMYSLEDKMQKIQTSFKEQQGAADKFHTLYTQYEAMDKDGKLSDYDRGKWKTIQGFMKGDTKTTYLNYNPETQTGEWMSNQIDEKGNPLTNKLSVADIDNGRVAPLLKLELNGKEGIINNYVTLMGTYKKEYYSQNRDHSESGYSKYAENNLKTAIYNDLDDSEVKDLSAQFFNTRDGLDSPEKIAIAKNKVVAELQKRVMMTEDTTNSSKLNTDQELIDERIRKDKENEALKRAKGNEELESAGRLKYDANNAIKGDYAGLIGVTIASPDKKSNKVSTDVSEKGDKLIVYFNDGSIEEHAKTEPDLINFMARDKHFVGKDVQKLVETSIKGDVIPYERASIKAGQKAKIAQGLDKLKSSGITDDDDASTFINSYLPDGYKAENHGVSPFHTEIDIKDDKGGVITTVDYTDKKSISKAIEEVNSYHEKKGNNSKVNTGEVPKANTEASKRGL